MSEFKNERKDGKVKEFVQKGSIKAKQKRTIKNRKHTVEQYIEIYEKLKKM